MIALSASSTPSAGTLEIRAPEATPRTFSAALRACQWESNDSPDVATVRPSVPSDKIFICVELGHRHLLESVYEHMFAAKAAAKVAPCGGSRLSRCSIA